MSDLEFMLINSGRITKTHVDHLDAAEEVDTLEERGLVEFDGTFYRLTEDGRAEYA